MDYKEFYLELGKLLYAIAKADGEVQDEELHSIYKMVVSDLSDSLLFGRENEIDSYYTEFEFEALVDQQSEMHAALKSFKDYFEENHHLFNDTMIAVTLKAINVVAEAFDGIVPEEQAIIDEISAKLKG